MKSLGGQTVVNDTKVHLLLRMLFCFILFLLVFTTNSALAALGINRQMTYFGILNAGDGEIVDDGFYDMVFRIYESETGGTAVWTGTHTAANGNPVEINDGNFVVLLGPGPGNTLHLDFDTDTYYVGITVGTDSEMSPRQRIGAAAYSFNSNSLDGLDSLSFVRSDASSEITSGTMTFGSSANLSFEGVTDNDYETTLDLIDPTADNTITFQDSSGTLAFLSDISAGANSWQLGTYGIYGNDGAVIIGPDIAETLSNASFVLSGNNDLFVTDALGVEGIIYTDGGLDVNNSAFSVNSSGEVTVTNTGSNNSLTINDQSSDTTPFVIDADGNVGIGTTSPSTALQVGEVSGEKDVIVHGDIFIGKVENDDQFNISNVGNVDTSFRYLQIVDNDSIGTFSGINLTRTGVGIGTSTPESALHIQHSDLLGTQVYLQPKDANERAIVGFYENDGNPLYTVGAREDSGTLFFSSGNLDPTIDTSPTLALLSNGNVGINSTNAVARLAVQTTGATDILNLFGTGGEVFTVLADGNVGIGTTSPSTKLSVAGETVASHFTATTTATSTFPTLSVTGRFYDANGTGGSSGEILQSTGSGVNWVDTSTIGLGSDTFLGLNDTISSYTTNRVLFQSGSGVTDSSNLIFDGTNLGVGTTSPSAMFAVAGTGYFGGNLTATGTLDVTATTTLTNDLIVDTDTLVVDSFNNRVGIGTTAPSTALEITGSASSSVSGDALSINPAFGDGLYVNIGGVRGIGVFQDGNLFMGYNTYYDPVSNSYEYGAAKEAAVIEWTNAGDINFATKASGSAGTEYTADSRMIIKNDGKVGIGTTSPSTTLSVVGNIYATGNIEAIGRIDGSNFINHETDTSVYVGIDAGTSAAVSSSNNAALGDQALMSINGGDRNTAVGFSALSSLTSGSSNTAVGRTALENLTTTDENIAIGFSALNQLSTGAQNTAIGGGAMFSGTTGADNVVLGYHALYANTDGASNVAIGKLAGRFLQDGTTPATSPDQSVLIGADIEFEAATDSNSIVIGYGAEGQGSNTVVLGNDSITDTFLKGNISIGTTSPETILHIEDDTFGLQTLKNTTAGQAAFTQWYNQEGVRVIVGADGSGFSDTEGQGSIATWTNHDIVIFTNQGERARFGTSTADALNVNGDMFVGTGTTGCVKDNDGTVIAGTCSSDERLKMNVLSASPVLERMGQLDFFTYQWNDTAQSLYGHGTEATQYGIIADQAEEVFPELVYEDEKGYKTFDYTRLMLYTAQSVKEIDEKVENQSLVLAEFVDSLQLENEGTGDETSQLIASFNSNLEQLEKDFSALKESLQQNADSISGINELNYLTEIQFEELETRIETLELENKNTFATQLMSTNISEEELESLLSEDDLSEYLELSDIEKTNYKLWEIVDKAIFTAKVRFENIVEFASNVIFRGSITVNTDTAGTITIPAGNTKAIATFNIPFEKTPIIGLTLTQSTFDPYSLEEVTEEGFVVSTPLVLEYDLIFNWTAVVAEGEPIKVEHFNEEELLKEKLEELSIDEAQEPVESETESEINLEEVVSSNQEQTENLNQAQSLIVVSPDIGFVHLHSESNIESQELDQIPDKTQLKYFEKENDWYKVEYEEKTGWIPEWAAEEVVWD